MKGMDPYGFDAKALSQLPSERLPQELEPQPSGRLCRHQHHVTPMNSIEETTPSPRSLLDQHAKQQFRESAAEAGEVTAQTDPRMPTQEEVESWYTDRRNWGRWGDNDQMGAINLITQEKSAAAAGLVRTGRKVSMSRVFEPEQHFMRKNARPGGASSVVDYYGFIYHGQTITHIDALCHMWDTDGMWQGRDPDVEITTQGATFGTIDAWSNGIVTRGVLIDVPRRTVALPT